MEFKNPINPTESDNLGVSIQKLIEQNICNINTCFLARIQAIGGDGLVDIVDIIKHNEKAENPVISGAIYGIPSTGLWGVSHNAKTGDIGLAIVLKNDINVYKMNKSGGRPSTQRHFNNNDCVFIPLNLLSQPSTDNYSIKSEDKKVGLTLSSDSIELKNNNTILSIKENIKLSNASMDIKSVLESIVDLFTKVQYGGYPIGPVGMDDLIKTKANISKLFD